VLLCRWFQPDWTGLRFSRILACSGVRSALPSTKKARRLADTGLWKARLVGGAECHKRKQRLGSVLTGAPAKHASMRCWGTRLDRKTIIVPIPSVSRPAERRVICVKLISEDQDDSFGKRFTRT